MKVDYLQWGVERRTSSPQWLNEFYAFARKVKAYDNSFEKRNPLFEQSAMRWINSLERKGVFSLESKETYKERYDSFYSFCEKIV